MVDKETGEILPDPPPPVLWKTPYNHDVDAEATRTALFCLDVTKTQQHGKEEADINTIVDRFLKTGSLPQVAIPPNYEDFDEVFDFQTAMNAVAAAKASFNAMDATVRDAFRNDPHRFVAQIDAWLNEPDPAERERNLALMRAMNLAVPKGEPADRTTLGDVLAAIKEQGTPKEPPAPKSP